MLLLSRLGLLLVGGPVELLALSVEQDVAVSLEEPQVHAGTGPVGAPSRVEDLIADAEGQARPGGFKLVTTWPYTRGRIRPVSRTLSSYRGVSERP